MRVANIVVETQPGKAQSVAELIAGLKGLELHSVKSDHQVLAVWCFPEGQHPEPEGVTEVLQAMTGEILAVALVEEEERV
jgi:flavodoxin